MGALLETGTEMLTDLGLSLWHHAASLPEYGRVLVDVKMWKAHPNP